MFRSSEATKRIRRVAVSALGSPRRVGHTVRHHRRLLYEVLEDRRVLSASLAPEISDIPPALFVESQVRIADSTAEANPFLRNEFNASVGAEGEGPGVLATTPSDTLTGLNQPYGLAFDGSGNLYVTNYGGNTVSKFAPGDTTPSDTLTGLDAPIGLAFDANGNLYVANYGNYAGTTVSMFAPGSTTPSATLTGLNGPICVAFDGANNLYVANEAGFTVSKFAPGSTTPSATLTGLNHPYALAFDGSGNLYVSNYGGNTISTFAPGDTTPRATLTGLNMPIALAFDGSSGNLYAANYSGGTVSKFAPGSTTPSATLTGLNGPGYLAFDGSGNLYVSNSDSNTVSKFAPGSTMPTATLTGLNGPHGLAFDGSGDLYVANGAGSSVTKFSMFPLDPLPTVTLTGNATDLVHALLISWSAPPSVTTSLTSINLAGTDITQYVVPVSATSAVVPALSFPATASLPLTLKFSAAGSLFESTTQLAVVPPDFLDNVSSWGQAPLDLMAKTVANEALPQVSQFSNTFDFAGMCTDLMQAAGAGDKSTLLQIALEKGIALLFESSAVSVQVGGTSNSFMLADVRKDRLSAAQYAQLVQQPDEIRQNELVWGSFLTSFRDFFLGGFDTTTGVWHPSPNWPVGVISSPGAQLSGVMTQVRDTINQLGPSLAGWFNSVFSVRFESPVDVSIVDMTGHTLSWDSSAIPYTFTATTTDPGVTHAIKHLYVYWPLPGDYKVVATPLAGTRPEDVYTLIEYRNGQETILADNMPVGLNSAAYPTTVRRNSPAAFRNYPVVYDTNADWNVTPLDALLPINHINVYGSGTLPPTPAPPAPYVDVDGNGAVTALDVLLVINYLNTHSLVAGEGEATSIATPSLTLGGRAAYDQSVGSIPSDAWGQAAGTTPTNPERSVGGYPANGDGERAAPDRAVPGRDTLPAQTREKSAWDDVDQNLGELESILPAIAQAVFNAGSVRR